MEIKIINEIRDEIKVFKSIEEFNLYYQKNKDSMEKLTTYHLNKIFKIELPDGTVYRITKKNCGTGKGKTLSGDIFLKKVVQQKVDSNEQPLRTFGPGLSKQPWEIALESVKMEIVEQKQSIADIKNRLEKIAETVNILAKVVNTIQGYDS